MVFLEIEESYSEQLHRLFEEGKHVSPMIERGFAISRRIETGGLLALGLNPSYTESENPSQPRSLFYDLKQDDNYSYFKKFEELSKAVDIRWSHFDMLFVRETHQSAVLDLAKNKAGLEFIWNHLTLTKEILELTFPRVILVANTASRRFLGKDCDEHGNNEWLGYKFQFDKQIGTHRIGNEESNLFGTPVFFTSMLTGQRALDKGSYERLVWHVEYALTSERP